MAIQAAVKTWLFAVLALPVVVLRCLLACADCCLGACDMKLRCGVWLEPVKEAVREPCNKSETSGQDKRYDIDCVMQFVSLGTDRKINEFRQGIESGALGRRVVMCNHNRHLYAVLEPNRPENLQRILNVLTVADTETIRKCREKVGV